MESNNRTDSNQIMTSESVSESNNIDNINFAEVFDQCVDNFCSINNLENYHLTIKANQDRLLDELINCYVSVFKDDYKEGDDKEGDDKEGDDKDDDKDNVDSICLTSEELELVQEHCDIYIRNMVLDYHNTIQAELDRIDAIILPEQRTSEWFVQRSKIISASEMAYACHITNKSDYERTLYKKIGVLWDYGMGNAALHGTIFEVVTQEIYELRYGVFIKEYGCLPHKEHEFIGASPDGVVHDINDSSNLSQLSLLGRMVEIKNPYSRKIIEIIKPEYEYQMQTQLEVADLHICDFIESDIKPFCSTFDEFFEEKFVLTEDNENLTKNHNIPLCNLASNGLEKGILLYFSKKGDDRDVHIGELYPLNIPYEKIKICEWIYKTIKQRKDDGFNYNETKFWKVNVYDIKTVLRDKQKWDNIIFPNVKQFWDNVTELRELTDVQILERFDKLEICPDRVITNKYQRKLKKRRSPRNSNRFKKRKVETIYQFSS